MMPRGRLLCGRLVRQVSQGSGFKGSRWFKIVRVIVQRAIIDLAGVVLVDFAETVSHGKVTSPRQRRLQAAAEPRLAHISSIVWVKITEKVFQDDTSQSHLASHLA